ncbi:MAG: 50S ribosomal protein L28 [Alphaproteobacteria bacterium]|nr:50S ribosomal protein L28 [Alphaproteobacteria bacterium]
MARRCELTGVGVQTGHKVSHSNRKTNTRFLPNLQEVSLMSEALGTRVPLRITAAALRSVEHNGGLDAYLLSHASDKLTAKGRRLKQQIKKKAQAAA